MFHVSDRLQVLLSNLAAQVMRVASSLFLMRLIPPTAHGDIAQVAAAAGLFASFGDFGLRRLLVQKRDWPEEQVRDTLFVLLVGTGLVLLMIFLATGWYLAITNVEHGWFFDVATPDYRLFWIAAILGATQFLASIYESQLALMSRRLAFASETRQQLLFATVQAASGIAYAYAGLGVFALALQPLTAQVIGNITVLRYQPLFWPRQFSREVAKSCIKPCVHIGLAFYFAAVSTPLQQWLYFLHVGRSKEMLAYFQKIIQVREMVTFSFVYNAFDRLIFPLFSQGQHDPTRLKDLFLRFSATVTVFVSLCGWGFVTTAPELVRVAAGPAWESLNDPNLIRALCLPLLLTTGTGAVSLSLCSALNRNYVWSIHSIIIVVLSFGTIFGAKIGGPVGMILGFSLAQIVASIFVIRWALMTLQLPLTDLLRRLAMPLLIGFVSGITVLTIKPYILAAAPAWQRLLVIGATFTVLFAILAWVLDRDTVNELRRLVRRKQKAPSPAEEA